ncbi:similar to Saccharomyces cerevisiae YHR047C AAP1 Arginine/alanine aminopeptidase, overproduction stimulates glycogen accumulation [Maudiozyma barnettii]|uniref:Aminopeptidase n=1 Tax=Maudiozyma barnettii TaxID=61262 RepID=A0A8H2ZG34_9SACH|nr:arginine/alanine aminopeptidase [Kazachstania barnettii]CAB4252380.1 similar to Saccharomyces cerevisiae YHR047C AAP1 Arginine/alanine aminopeptidase, overproduction stimulates glycogen accumulation [Kazachstania barnettii]CAD1779115.1 similar to Saccharomyces cerevisiae YHR047C AAP1 Arginine/alanine aminopeptidase, overproduction stimulates glycogen accumulation [Kazachstania barnettii]
MSDREILPTNVTPLHYYLSFEPDFSTFKFNGKTSIDLKVNDKTNDVITLNAVELDIHEVTIDGKDESIKATKIEFNTENQTVSFSFPEGTLAQSSEVKLNTIFTGILNDQMAGFYRAKYQDKTTGETKYMATTQMEATDARRAFPCFDEPNLKAKFTIELISDVSLTHLSNMDVNEEKINDNKKITSFNPTPDMSTYLVAFIVADLKYVENNSGRTPVKVYATPGDEANGQFAADLASRTLTFFEKTFNIEYPLPKMDMVAVHEFSAGAMENWGLVTYRVIDVLLDEKNASLDRVQRVAEVIQHELAHQWFGNLVTMDWWEGLWLNEGFATWMSWYSCNNFQPEWKVWEQYVSDNLQRAIGLDSLRSSHPIEVPVKNADEINQIFDAISYSKGSSLLRMVSKWLGEETFIKGVSNYLNKFKYGNAKTEDLWDHLAAASGKDVNKVMKIWTKKVGFPLITVIESKNKLTFIQHRYLSTGDVQPEEDETIYPVFLSIKTKNGVDTSLVLDEKIKSFDIKYGDFYKINSDQAGLFITAYPAKRWSTFGKQRKLFSVEDRTGLVADAKNLSAAGYISSTSFLDLIAAWKDEDSFVVWEQICNSLNSVRSAWLFADDKVQDSIVKYMTSIVSGKVKKMKWTFDSAESYDDQRLKVVLFRTAATCNLDSIVKLSFDMFKKRISGDKDAIPALIRPYVFSVVAKNGSVEDYESILKIYKETENSDEKIAALRVLGGFKDANLIERTLGYVIDGTILNQDIYIPLVSMRGHKEGVLAMWAWLQKNLDLIVKRLHPSSPLLGHVLNVTISGFTSYQDISMVKEFFESKDTKGYDKSLAQAIDTVESKAQWVARDAEDVEKYLKEKKFLA